MDTRIIGDVAEYKFVLYCIERGIEINKPLNSLLQHDFVVNINGNYKKVQIKSRQLKDGKIADISKFKQQKTKSKKLLEYNNTNIDMYIVYCPNNGKFYNIPLDLLNNINYSLVLRVDTPKNGQLEGVRFAKDFELVL
jgi:hypothetical protein